MSILKILKQLLCFLNMIGCIAITFMIKNAHVRGVGKNSVFSMTERQISYLDGNKRQ